MCTGAPIARMDDERSQPQSAWFDQRVITALVRQPPRASEMAPTTVGTGRQSITFLVSYLSMS